MLSLKSPAPIRGTDVKSVIKTMTILCVVAPLMTVTLTGCAFQPLYGTTSSGNSLRQAMKSVEITPIPGRVGQKLRNELIFETTGGGYADQSEYRLDIVVRESVRAINVNLEGDARGQIYMLDTTFKLVSKKTGQTVFQGSSRGRAAFDKFDSIFANTRARIDAEARAARTVAQTIKTRVAAHLSRSA